MKAQGYIAIWVILILFTIIEILIFGLPLPTSLIVPGILSLAAVKALLIALFYQHLLHTPTGISTLYFIALLGGIGITAGMIASL